MDHKNSTRMGYIAECSAIPWLLKQGWEVFRNVTPVGPADLIVWNPETGEIIPVDVKRLRFVDGKPFKAQKDQKSKRCGVKALHCHPESGECLWDNEAASHRWSKRE